MFAGSDKTAGTIAMAIYQLAQNTYIQDTLRAELTCYSDNIPYEQIDDLPYLDAVVKEVLRVYPSLPGTRDDIIPLSSPVKLSNGKVVNEMRVRKGQLIHIPIEHLHTSPSIWGKNASTFDPSRFLGVNMPFVETPRTASFPVFNPPWSTNGIPEKTTHPEVSSDRSRTSSVPFSVLHPFHQETRDLSSFLSSSSSPIPDPIHHTIPRKTSIPNEIPPGPGIYPNFMTFLDGPRRCIGYKLAILEIKIMLFVLIKHLQFSLKGESKIWRWNMMSTRPYVEGSLFDKGSSLPVIVVKHFKG
ncbi:uncharacterized protein IL334_004376 [Kwoniella shivajii]|uniref:Cytochrome P450 n=1 Tax=Kwoniella shivajii TaxID=564305 RepID=A0ABZ1D051_9TREE|nr:hypothetical protein IL334_004376 [Kwoniella shivajii]